MKAIVRDEYGTPEVLQIAEIDQPTVGEGEVLVEVMASSVNPMEWHMMTGKPRLARLSEGLRRPKRRWLGADFAGTVVAVGSGVDEFAVGDEVFGEARGAYAEYAVTSPKSIVPKPENVTFAEAGSVGVAALTALQALRDSGGIQPGQRVLINGASGGVGTFAVQIAKAFGAEVTAVCSTRNVALMSSIGADRIIDYTAEDFTQNPARYDLVLDNVGNRGVLEVRRLLAPGGVYVAVSGPKNSFLILARMLRMVLVSLVGGRKMRPMLAKTNRNDLAVLAEMMEAGKVTPVIERTYSLDELPAAMRKQGEFHAQGKSVILVGGQDGSNADA